MGIPTFLLYHTGDLATNQFQGVVLSLLAIILGILGWLPYPMTPFKLRPQYRSNVPERFHPYVPKLVGLIFLGVGLDSLWWAIHLTEADVAVDTENLPFESYTPSWGGIILILLGSLGWILPYKWNPLQFSRNPIKLGWVFARVVPKIHHTKVPRVVGSILMLWGLFTILLQL